MDKSAGIEIENIPPGITREDLMKLFEKEMKDENEIKYILFPLQDNRHSAFVCFKRSPDKAFIERLAACNPAWHITLDARMQTYCSCTAEVDALIVATIPDIPACIAMLEKDYGIKASYDDDSGKFVLQGMMHQLQCAQVRLDEIFKQQLTLQKMQLLQIGRSNETSVERSSPDKSERRDAGSGTTSLTAGRDYRLESWRDLLDEKRGLVVGDRIDKRESNNRFSVDSEFQSLPVESLLNRDRDFDLKRMRHYEEGTKSRQYEEGTKSRHYEEGTKSRHYEDETKSRYYEDKPISFTSADRTRFLSTFDRDQNIRSYEPVSLPDYSDTGIRRSDYFPTTGDRRLFLQSDEPARIGHSGDSEFMKNSDSHRSHSRKVAHTSVLDEKVDTFASRYVAKDRIYTTGKSGDRGDYQSAHTSKSRVSSDLAPSGESVEWTAAGRRMRSEKSDQPDGREEVDFLRESKIAPSFWKEKLVIDEDRLRSLPLFVPKVEKTVDDPFEERENRNRFSADSEYRSLPAESVRNPERDFDRARMRHYEYDPKSHRDHQHSEATGHSNFSQDQISTAENRQERSDKPGGFGEDLDDGSVAASSEEEKTLFLETYVVRYIMAVEKLSVNIIKERYKVGIKLNTEPGAEFSMVVFTGLSGQHPDRVEKASKRFAELYEKTFNVIIQREVSVNVDFPEVADVVERLRGIYRVIVATEVAGIVTLVGEFLDVMKAVDMLNGAQSEIEAGDHQSGSGKFEIRSGIRQSGAGKDSDINSTLRARPDLGRISVSRAEETSRFARQLDRSPESKFSVPKSLRKTEENFYLVGDVGEPRSSAFVSMSDANRYTMTFRDNFQVFIYTGDITKIRVHAIVNAANSLLKNYSGVAGAIEDAGGPQFKKKCEDFYDSHGPLKVTEVTHMVATGNLRCHDVIHTVGPHWYAGCDEDECAATLLTTFENVLNYAEEAVEAESVAVPAVGTGIFGVPVDLCARAIYGAVNEFLENFSSSTPILKSLHVVNKDPGTTELIQAVFEGLRQLELENQMKSKHSRSPAGGDEQFVEGSADVAPRRPSSERKMLDEKSGRDRTSKPISQTKRNSILGSDSDDSELNIDQQTVRERTGHAKNYTEHRGVE